ncbi:MAG: hypothetical protein MUP85_16660 [Candidatus Lokiarchaeota archaeon]|nr:hypothetical protein [Candidatus Lokiarchaeota archaeon]
MDKHSCPICGKELKPYQRYPNYVCKECSSKAVSKSGRQLIFSNIDFSGGYIAYYKDTEEEYDSHLCYIDGVECIADEARFGGIVIQVKK